MSDFTTRRRVMVDTQVRPSDITRFPIIEAMLRIPREEFVPNAMRDVAYLGEAIPVHERRVILDPRVMAKMINVLSPDPQDLVLDLGCAYGYSAAILAHVSQAVVAVEPQEMMAGEASTALSEYGADNATVEIAPLDAGVPSHGPYDAIMLEGAIERLPGAIEDQLADGGRIVAIFNQGRLGIVRHGVKIDGRINWRPTFNANAPVLPGFEATREFTL